MATACRSRLGASSALLDLVVLRRLTLLATTALFLEYEDVLKRPEQRAASGLTTAGVDRLLAGLAAVAEPVTVWYQRRPQLRDQNDELVLEAAVNGRADALVTYNVRDFASGARRFGIRLARPAEILKEVLR